VIKKCQGRGLEKAAVDSSVSNHSERRQLKTKVGTGCCPHTTLARLSHVDSSKRVPGCEVAANRSERFRTSSSVGGAAMSTPLGEAGPGKRRRVDIGSTEPETPLSALFSLSGGAATGTDASASSGARSKQRRQAENEQLQALLMELDVSWGRFEGPCAAVRVMGTGRTSRVRAAPAGSRYGRLRSHLHDPSLTNSVTPVCTTSAVAPVV